jgi:hypothetical protein
MSSIIHAGPKLRRKHLALIVALALPLAAGAVYLFGYYMECEYIHWRTIWQASRARTPSGIRVADLIRTRATTPSANPHWHHCSYCETVYAHAKFAIKVRVSASEEYLFDWDATTPHAKTDRVAVADGRSKMVPGLLNRYSRWRFGHAEEFALLVRRGGDPAGSIFFQCLLHLVFVT